MPLIVLWGNRGPLVGVELVADLGGAFVVLLLNRFSQRALELLLHADGVSRLKVRDKLGQCLQGTGALIPELFGIYRIHIMDTIDCLGRDFDRTIQIIVIQMEQGDGGGVYADNIGPPTFKVHAVFFGFSVTIDESKYLHVSLGVAYDACIILDLEEKNVTLVSAEAFLEELSTVLGRKAELGVVASLGDTLGLAILVVVEDKIPVVVATPGEVHLKDALKGALVDADLHLLDAVRIGDLTNISRFISGLVLEDFVDIMFHGNRDVDRQ